MLRECGSRGSLTFQTLLGGTREQRGGMAEEGAAERTLHLLKRLVGNPEASKDELKVLKRLSHVSVHSNPHWQTEQDRQGPLRGRSELKPGLQVSRPSKQPGGVSAGALCWTLENLQRCLSQPGEVNLPRIPRVSSVTTEPTTLSRRSTVPWFMHDSLPCHLSPLFSLRHSYHFKLRLQFFFLLALL